MRVSIIIPVYNSQDTVQKAIESALNQKFPRKDFEVIVINDGSTDKTLEILKKYKGQIRIINQKNRGAVKAANKGFKEARGRYVIKIDADDYLERNILKEMAEVLDKNPEIDFVYCDYYETSEKRETKIISTRDNIFNTAASGIMFRKNKFAKEGFYNENIKFAEYDLLLKTLNKWKSCHIPKLLFYYVRKKNSITGNKPWVKEALAELKKSHPQKLEEIKKIRKY